MPHPTSSRDFDAIRAAHPEVAFYVTAVVLGGVTLELVTPDQQVYRFDGKTLAEALEAAFPSVTREAFVEQEVLGIYGVKPEPEASAMAPDIFD